MAAPAPPKMESKVSFVQVIIIVIVIIIISTFIRLLLNRDFIGSNRFTFLSRDIFVYIVVLD